MNEFITDNIVTIWVIAFVFEVLMGMLAQFLAERKGHTRRWFWAGFLLSLVGVIWVAGLPDETVRRQLKRLGDPPQAAPAAPVAQASAAEDDSELVAVLTAAIAALGEQEGKKFILRSFRPVGEGVTPWSRAGRMHLQNTLR